MIPPIVDEAMDARGEPAAILATLYAGDLLLSTGLASLPDDQYPGTFYPTDGALLGTLPSPPTTLRLRGKDEPLSIANFQRLPGAGMQAGEYKTPVYRFEVLGG